VLSAAKEETFSAFGPWCAETCISASKCEGEKPHQGVASKNPALHQGITWSNSTTALGLRGARLETRVRSRCTGKERDTESGNDYFGARYYGSSLGRFMTPDWAAKPTNVPYASFGNPQSLNLYSYVNNNPTTTRDPDGHVAGVDDAAEALVFTAAVFTTAVVIYESQPQNQRNFAEATSQAFTNTVDTVKSWFQSSPKQSQSNPWQGKPGETVQTTRPDGTPQQTRRYGPDGYPETDVDHSPHHGQPDPHAHDIGRPADGSPPTAADRGPGRNVQPGDPQPQQQQQPQTQPQQQVQPQPPPPPPPQQKEPQ
jgi:RHS repeat-associated protein